MRDKVWLRSALVAVGLLWLGASGLIAAARPAAAAGDFYVKKGTWQETMLASRERYQRATRGASTKDALSLGPWYTTGALKARNFRDSLFPEKRVDLKGKYKDGKPLWREGRWADGKVHNLPGGSNVSTYLCRTITAGRAMKVTASLGSDDGLELWLRGKKVLSRDVGRGAEADQDQAVLDLVRGKNELLFKIHNNAGGHGFYFSLDGSPLAVLWRQIEKDFPTEAGWMKKDLGGRHLEWFESSKSRGVQKEMMQQALLSATGRSRRDYKKLTRSKASPNDRRWLDVYVKMCGGRKLVESARGVNPGSLRMAIEDLVTTFSARYEKGAEFLSRLDAAEKGLREGAADAAAELAMLQREALLANPLLDFDKLLVVKRDFGNKARGVMSKSVGLPANFNTYHAMRGTGWNNEIAVISNLRGEPNLRTLYKTKKGEMVTEMDLHFDGDRLMFSSIGSHGRWHLFEMKTDGTGLKQITPGDFPDVDFFDSCYLPNGKIAVTSGAGYQGLPCVGGGSPMAQMFLFDPKTKKVRQITFEQDSDWCPVVLNNGRVMYLRWEYTDTPHYFTRILFHCNPDGTEQMELYGSNSYFPNAFFYARPVPGRSGKLVGVAGGHHGIGRSGRMLIIDPARSRHEAGGVVQEIPGYGKRVPAIIKDALVNGVWPQFVHPWPLSEKYHLVAMKPDGRSLWGIHLVDVFDNMVLVKEVEGSALLEPIPLQRKKTPPVVAEKVQLGERNATVYLYDVYTGPGLVGIPRGKVKKLRVIAYHFCYNKTGGHASVGVESSWDIKRILGTVPVDADGSALFKVPANTPLAVQPLDEEGRAIQLMQSWFVAMPGENVSCVGCHDKQNMSPPARRTVAARRTASKIEPWYGPVRPFAFSYEVQPVLDKYCVGCHDGKDKKKPNFTRNNAGSYQKDEAYLALHPFVRRPGPESDYHMFKPMEYHASTSELVQMLKKGHHNVKLDAEAWDRLYTWIDLNVPWRGKWSPRDWRGQNQRSRRLELAKLYANLDDDPEGEHDRCAATYAKRRTDTPVKPRPLPKVTARAPKVTGWPFDAATAKRRQASGGQAEKSIDLGGGQRISLVRIPAGEFVMGSADGYPDERPLSRVKIAGPFWMGTCEVTNAQYKQFDSTHDSRYIDQQWKDHTTPGYPANGPGQPVIRVTWKRAMAFCKWLGAKTGQTVTLPTEAEWEWACRAGTATPLYYGDLNTDFSSHANLADVSIKLLAVKGVNPRPVRNPNRLMDFTPKDARFNDKAKVVTDVGRYGPNPWGLKDMHGNVAEWTLSTFKPYPYHPTDGRDSGAADGPKVARGGSWRDRPKCARSALRLAYEPYQPVANVGFRVVVKSR